MLKIKSFAYQLVMLSVLFFQIQANAAEHPKLSDIPSADCGVCHQAIYKQWESSMHAQSTALKDPIHGTFYNAVIGSPTEKDLRKNGKYPVCLQCHAPGAAKDGVTDLSSKPIYSEGVNCVTCHSLTKYKGTKKPGGGLQLGMLAYEYTDESIQGPSGRTIHPEILPNGTMAPVLKITGNATMLKTNAVCMGCHDQRKNFNKVSLCRTGGEIAEATGTTDCQLCHMPAANGVVDHSFMGGHNKKMVAKGIEFKLKVKSLDSSLRATVTLRNKLPHNFPTGAPFRNVFIIVKAIDASGIEVWKNTQSHPIKDDDKSVLMYKIGDDNNKLAPPPKATKVLGDTRLKPHEIRDIHYDIKANDVVKVTAEIFYDLLLPGNKKKFAKQIPAPLKQPKLIATAEVEL